MQIFPIIIIIIIIIIIQNTEYRIHMLNYRLLVNERGKLKTHWHV
jgi:hypothetical protein